MPSVLPLQLRALAACVLASAACAALASEACYPGETMKQCLARQSRDKSPGSSSSSNSHRSQSDRMERGGMYGECISQFKDAKYYNWISFRNSCGEDLHVTFIQRDRPGSGGSSMTLRAGGSDNTGMAEREVPGGFTLAICRAGFIPVDANRRSWRGGEFQCKPL